VIETSDMRLDGNALGGALLDVFGVEMTVAVATCGSCGARGEVARLEVYVKCPGTVARCPACGAVVLRIVEGRERIWLDLSGTRTLEIVRPD
jgi:Zn finger protein HypA/HybF involved in hydrogenase expression